MYHIPFLQIDAVLHLILKWDNENIVRSEVKMTADIFIERSDSKGGQGGIPLARYDIDDSNIGILPINNPSTQGIVKINCDCTYGDSINFIMKRWIVAV